MVVEKPGRGSTQHSSWASRHAQINQIRRCQDVHIVYTCLYSVWSYAWYACMYYRHTRANVCSVHMRYMQVFIDALYIDSVCAYNHVHCLDVTCFGILEWADKFNKVCIDMLWCHNLAIQCCGRSRWNFATFKHVVSVFSCETLPTDLTQESFALQQSESVDQTRINISPSLQPRSTKLRMVLLVDLSLVGSLESLPNGRIHSQMAMTMRLVVLVIVALCTLFSRIINHCKTVSTIVRRVIGNDHWPTRSKLLLITMSQGVQGGPL